MNLLMYVRVILNLKRFIKAANELGMWAENTICEQRIKLQQSFEVDHDSYWHERKYKAEEKLNKLHEPVKIFQSLLHELQVPEDF